MVDVSGKATTKREAVAGATVQLGPTAFEALSDNAKGELAPLSLPWLFALSAREAQHLSELPWRDTPPSNQATCSPSLAWRACSLPNGRPTSFRSATRC